MSVADEVTPVSSPRSVAPHPRRRLLARTGASALTALAAGMRASKDYRHLNGMTDRQLATLGLTRDGIPQELHRRHFANLPGRAADIR